MNLPMPPPTPPPTPRVRPSSFVPRPVQGRVEVDADDPSLLRMSGEVDLLTVQTADERLPEQLRKVSMVDVSDLTFMDTMGLHCLVTAMVAARERGGRVHLLHPTPIVLRVLEISGLAEHFDITRRPPVPVIED